MHKAIKWVVVGGTLALPGGLAAQDTLRVDQDRIDGSFIESFSVVWHATRTQPGGIVGPSFTVEEEYEVIGEGDDALLKMTQVWNDTIGETLFISVRVSERKNMEYRAFHTGRSPGSVGHLDFDEGFVSGMYAPAPEQSIRSYALQLDERPFASMSGIMIASFPLEDGAEFVYPGFGWGGMTNPAVSWRTVEVVGRERLSIPGRGEMLAWKVKTGNLWYWLSREAPYFLRAEAVAANGGKTTFDVQSWEAGTR